MYDSITTEFVYNGATGSYYFDGTKFTITFKELVGPFRRSGECNLTSVTIEWENPTRKSYVVGIQL